MTVPFYSLFNIRLFLPSMLLSLFNLQNVWFRGVPGCSGCVPGFTDTQPKRLQLEKEETDSLYHCPIQVCDHDGFKSQRGCRKHVNTKHSWFSFFDGKPDISSTKELADDDTSGEITKKLPG